MGLARNEAKHACADSDYQRRLLDGLKDSELAHAAREAAEVIDDELLDDVTDFLAICPKLTADEASHQIDALMSRLNESGLAPAEIERIERVLTSMAPVAAAAGRALRK